MTVIIGTVQDGVFCRQQFSSLLRGADIYRFLGLHLETGFLVYDLGVLERIVKRESQHSKEEEEPDLRRSRQTG